MVAPMMSNRCVLLRCKILRYRTHKDASKDLKSSEEIWRDMKRHEKTWRDMERLIKILGQTNYDIKMHGV